MNTRGEQLELHEIAKAKLLEVLESDHDKDDTLIILFSFKISIKNKETGKWSLQRLEKYRDKKKNNDKPKYVGTLGDEGNDNKKLRTLQSCLRITVRKLRIPGYRY